MAYEYQHVTVIRVIDGDTVELSIDMGNKTRWQSSFRIRGIDAPEMHGASRAAGEASKAVLTRLLSNGIERVTTHKPDKYGRWLVDIKVSATIPDVAARMVEDGHAWVDTRF